MGGNSIVIPAVNIYHNFSGCELLQLPPLQLVALRLIGINGLELLF